MFMSMTMSMIRIDNFLEIYTLTKLTREEKV